MQIRREVDASVVLVHEAWEDGSSWMEVIALLQAARCRVAAVQLPLAGLAGDLAALQRALDRAHGPVVLVGHGWGGTVVSATSAGDRVAGLVYLAAYAPQPGQSTRDLCASAPKPDYSDILEADAGGYLWFPPSLVPAWIAQDLPAPNAQAFAATQRPIHRTAFDDRSLVAAWRGKPTWYLMTTRDRVVVPQLQRTMAARIGARLHRVQASHAAQLSCPKEVAAVILEAIAATLTRSN